MRRLGIGEDLTDMIKALYSQDKSAVLLNNQICDFFNTSVGVRQGCLLSPVSFNIFLKQIMMDALAGFQPTTSVEGTPYMQPVLCGRLRPDSRKRGGAPETHQQTNKISPPIWDGS